MNERLNKYFFGNMEQQEKEKLFQDLENDEQLKNQFLKLTNELAVSRMAPEKGDSQYAEDALKQFRMRMQKPSVFRLQSYFVRYAAAVVLILILSVTAYYTFRPDTISYTEYIASEGKRLEVALPDGSTACLAPASRIRFPENFKGKNRQVELDGEALFDVVKNTDKPFLVETDKYNVKVLGTKFNVRSYSKDTVYETALINGSVCVFNQHEEVILSPDERVILHEGRLIKTSLDLNDISFMESGVYVFEDKPLDEILARLETWYNIKFHITNKELLKYSALTGKVREENNVESFLKSIQRIHPFKSRKINDSEIEIY